MPTDENLGRIIAGRYRVRCALGAGAHGRVYLAEDLGRGGAQVALKLVQGLVGGPSQAPAEGLLRRFRHPGWAAVLDQGMLGDDASFQALQYVPGRSLEDVEGPQPEDVVWALLEDGARVLGALHRLGLIHYDVTPGNLLWADGDGRPHFVLTDGGLANLGPVRGVARGTPLYMAPEVTEDKGHDHRADLYALGLVAYRLATGREPFVGAAGDVLGRRRREDAPRARTLRPGLSEALDQVLAELVERAPNQRPHDAQALLERIGQARGRPLPAFLHAEGVAAAEGGPLAGRGDETVRFDASLEVLAQRLAAGTGRLARARAPQLEDPVLLLTGRPSSGCTRLADELLAHARERRIPALLMSGSQNTGDRRGPLRHLVDGMATLALPAGVEPQPIRLDLGARKALGREERAHALTRAVEQFVRGVESTAARTPFVLVVEDFGDLPERAREAVRVLSRHLLAKRESGGATSAPPVLLVVDLGAESPEIMVVPDARDPGRPVVELDPLAPEDLARFCADRFGGLEPTRADLERIAEVSEGLPGVAAMLLAEGCRRGDLRPEAGRWSWRVDDLPAYEIRRGLGPLQAEALRVAGEGLRTLLACLSLVEAPVHGDIAGRLWARHATGPIPASPLLRTTVRDGVTQYTTSNLAVRKAVLADLPADARDTLTSLLLDELEREDSPETALDRARLHAARRAFAAAIACLQRWWPCLPQQHRQHAQGLLAEAVDADPTTISSQEARRRISRLVEPGRDGTLLATRVAGHLATGEDETAAELASYLNEAREHRLALDLIDRALTPKTEASSDVFVLQVLRSVVLFDLHRVEDGRTAIETALATLSSLGAAASFNHDALCRLRMVQAQAAFLVEDTGEAIHLLRDATLHAKAADQTALRAQVLNNLGIVQQQAGNAAAARQLLQRALRIRTLIGDMDGVMKALLNLGRVEQGDGHLVKSASLYQRAAAVAQRHDQPAVLLRGLRFLAQTYDQQLNTRLAVATLTRAVTAGVASRLAADAARAAWDLAPLAASAGEVGTAAWALRCSASAARTQLMSYARGAHYLVHALVAMHQGSPRQAAHFVSRACCHRGRLYPELLALHDALTEITSNAEGSPGPAPTGRGRPSRWASDRFLYRARVWMGKHLKRPDRPLAQPKFSSRTTHGQANTPVLGRDRRLFVEMALRIVSQRAAQGGSSLEASLERHLVHTGELMLLGRLLALRSMRAEDGRVRAQQFSRAIQLVSRGPSAEDAGPGYEPAEHLLAYARHLKELGFSDQAPPARASALHALAHHLLTHHGCTAAPDGRVASALRRVLAATGRMNAGAGLDDLLQGMTHDTIEITGAERACVVLVDPNADLEVRVATSAGGRPREVDVEDLSQTVIQRVIDSRSPLLLHDVFDDEELMGRPSITSLSLRSILCVPMTRSDTLYGVLYADSASAAGSFDHIDQEVLSLFAEQAAAALETHRLVADVQNSMAELKAMQERLVKGERLRTMGELSSGVAHEFNNLLTSILARVQLISLNNIGVELRQDLDLIEKACLDAAAVVRRLQSYTRKQRQEDYAQVDVGEICNDAVEFLRPLWSTRRRHGRAPVVVRLRADDGLHVQGNATELREVVTNLLKNALDALADGGEATVRAVAAEGLVRVIVEDDGPGIPTEIQGKIFDPFFTTKGERGTGLGLCLSQQIVERHGGELRLQSKPGEGTRVLIELPAAETLSQAIAHTEDAQAGVTPRLRVLVVDDDENVRVPLSRFLEKHGWEVLTAPDGAVAERLVRQHRPDVVISDVAMPQVDGLELCRRLRRGDSGLPIILMSGWTSGVDPARARRAGATALLGKPFALQQVTELLTSIAEAAHRSHDARPRRVDH